MRENWHLTNRENQFKAIQVSHIRNCGGQKEVTRFSSAERKELAVQNLYSAKISSRNEEKIKTVGVR